MENGNKPINPIPHERMDSYGLTKREYFAGLAMQSLLQKHSLHPNITDCDKQFLIESVAKDAVYMADKLLEELEQ